MRTLGKLATLLGITAVLGATTFGATQPAEAHCHDHWRYNHCNEHRYWQNQGYNNYNRYPAYGYGGGGYPAYNAYGYGGGYNGYNGPGMMTRVFGRVF